MEAGNAEMVTYGTGGCLLVF